MPGHTNQVEWWIDDEIVAYGRKPGDLDMEAFQGIHAGRVLVVVDEACGIAEAIWNGADSLITNDESRSRPGIPFREDLQTRFRLARHQGPRLPEPQFHR